jgi:hypothetical protein
LKLALGAALTTAASLLFVWTACTVSEVNYAGKTCSSSCPSGLTCIDGTCQQLAALVYATDFHVAWATPNSIRWAWTLQGQQTALVDYQLIVSSPLAGAAGARTWTSADNEELGGYEIKNSGSFDVVTGTITWEMAPSTQYSAILRLTDIDGNTFETPSVTAVTDVARSRQLVIFDGTLAPGAYLLPDKAFSLIGDGGLEGGPSLHYEVPATAQITNLQYGGFSIRASAASIAPKLFDVAYLEFWIRGIGTPGSSWSDVYLVTPEADGGPCVAPYSDCIYHCPIQWLYHPDSMAPGTYRRVQLPLTEFSLQTDAGTPADGGALSLGQLVNEGITELAAECPYSAGDTATYVDQIAIWW